MINRRNFLKITGSAAFGIAALLMATTFARNADAIPNVVFIMADDLGYGDVGCYGATLIKTPHIDALANAGVSFTDAHTPAAWCTPTRYGLLTGNYPPQMHTFPPSARLIIPTNRMTLPSMFKTAGYKTGCIGKWHLGFGGKDGPDWNGELKPGPLEVGFDYYFGVPTCNNWPPFVYVENHEVYEREPGEVITIPKRGANRLYAGATDSTSKRKAEDIALNLTAKAVQFIKTNAEESFFLYFAPCNPHHPHTPNRRFAGRSEAGVYGDFIAELDWSVGEVMKVLKELNLLDNTLVVFTSDNGPETQDRLHYMGPRVKEHRSAGILRGQKNDQYEGGHRVPFIASWPGRIKPNTKSNALLCLTDMLATYASVIGVQLPNNAGKDSFNLLPVLEGVHDGHPIRNTLKHHKGAFRMNNWKLYKKELYDLDMDISEENNLYDKHPDIVKNITMLRQQQKAAGRSAPHRMSATIQDR